MDLRTAVLHLLAAIESGDRANVHGWSRAVRHALDSDPTGTRPVGALGDEALGDALHSAFHPGHPWSGCSQPDLVYTAWMPRFWEAVRDRMDRFDREPRGWVEECPTCHTELHVTEAKA